MKIKIRNLKIEHFKGCDSLEVSFQNCITTISGANATGKTTILDAVWWLLFNKDSSGTEKFEIRPLDRNGEKIHNIEISVFGIFEVERNGMSEIISLKKTQSERWVTKRGTITAELQGNDTKYEVNEFPKKESEYKAYINELIQEDLFKMLSNPMYFPSMPWKDQREILMQMVTDMTNVDFASEHEEFECILEDLSRGSLDDLTAKYRRDMSELKKQQKELPIRIDEVSKQKVAVDEKQLRKEKSELEGQLKEIEDFLAQEDVSTKIDNLNEHIVNLRIEHGKLVDKHREEYRDGKHRLEMAVVEASSKVDVLENQMTAQRNELDRNSQYINITKKQIVKLEEDLTSADAKDFTDEYSAVCPYCGQELPDGKITEIKEHFADEKAKSIASIKDNIKEAEKELERVEENYRHAEKSLSGLMEKLSKAKSELHEKSDALESLTQPVEIPLDVVNLGKQIFSLTEKLEELKKKDVSGYLIAMDSFKARIAEIDKELMAVDRNAEIDARIESLMDEERDVAQRATLVEQKAFALEQFIRFKMETISHEINEQFDGLEFQLFETQINGGIKECCECTINGVPYSDLNSGHKIIAGISIIKALQKKYDVMTPVFIDNCESLSSFNIPNMESQLVTMSVSDEQELSIK